MPAVSVIIPVYNPGQYLRLALQSVRDQTHSDWEALVVDDGSPQDVSWVNSFDDRVRYLRQKNRGQAIARNVGIQEAKGRYIAFLDQDDLWLPTKLQRQLEFMENDREIVGCHTQFSIIDAAGHKRCDGFGRDQTYYDLLEGSGICGASSMMVRRDHLIASGSFKTATEPAEDYDLWLRLASNGRIGFIPSCEVLYRQHGDNQTTQYARTYRAIRSAMNRHRRDAASRNDAAAMKSAKIGLRRIRGTFAAQAFDQFRIGLRVRSVGKVVRHLGWALRLSPSFVGRSICARTVRSAK